MSFSRQRPDGFWLLNSTIEPEELEYFDQAISQAFDAVDGGSYAPTADVVMGGAPGVSWDFQLPVSFGKDVTFNADAILTGEVTIGTGLGSATLSVNAASSFQGQAAFQALTTFNGHVICNDTIDINHQANFNSLVAYNGAVIFTDEVTIGTGLGSAFFYVNNQAQFNKPVEFTAGFNVVGEASFVNPVTLKGGGEVWGALLFSHDGRIENARIPKRQVIGGNVDASYAPALYDQVYVPLAAIDDDRIYTIDDTGAEDGDQIRFTNANTASLITVRSAGSNIAGLKNAGNNVFWCDVQRISGVWRLVASGIRQVV